MKLRAALLAGAIVAMVLPVLAGCRGQPQPTPAAAARVVEIAEATTPAMLAPTATELPPSPTATLTPSPTATATARPTATATATRTATTTPTPTPTPPVPLSVEFMRTQSYPGSEIAIEQTLQPGANYRRYIASYYSEGLKQYALLTVPNGTKPPTGWPVIIFNHGYIPPAQYRTTERYVAYVDSFARNGYIVFRPDYRGHGNSEGEATGGYGSPAYTIDVLNAVASIKRYPDADPDRIGMWGHSMGGHITLRAMVTTKDVKAGVIWAGVVASYPDLLRNWRRPIPTTVPSGARRWRDIFIRQFGTPEQNPSFWASISPSAFLADLSGPLQLHHGTADESVPHEFSANLYAQALAEGIAMPVEYYEYPGDNHNLSGNFNLAMRRSIAFFDKYVKNPGLQTAGKTP